MADLTGIGDVANLVGKVIDKIFPDPIEAAKAKAALLDAQNAGELEEIKNAFASAQSQVAVDQTEAASASFFVAGWRPFIGWICGCALGLVYLILPLLKFFLDVAGYTTPLPVVDMSTMMPLLLALLGLGGMRTYEKVQGVTAGHG